MSYNGANEDSLFEDSDFRMWCMKIIPCTKRFSHNWQACPYAHPPLEKATRRCPRSYEYTGIACPDVKKGSACPRGEHCPYAHSVFEYWLHPTRYRTQLCNDGPGCTRSFCFFAHSLDQLRNPACKPHVTPEAIARASLAAMQQDPHPLMDVQTPVATAAKGSAADLGIHQGGAMAVKAPPPRSPFLPGTPTHPPELSALPAGYGSPASRSLHPAPLPPAAPRFNTKTGSSTGSLPGLTSTKGGGSNGSPSTEPASEAELVQSLASLKFARTQLKSADSTASNHEVVISALQQVLQEAVKQQQDQQRDGDGTGASSGTGGVATP